MMLFLVAINFVSYFFLNLRNNFFLKLLFSVLFVFSCTIIKFNVDITTVPDFAMYYGEIGSKQTQLTFNLLFKEPYYYQFVNYLNKNHSAFSAIKVIYTFNFLLALAFFVWISFLDDISLWKKNVLFALFYYFFSYVLIRNTPAYVLIGILFYYIHKNKFIKISFLSFLAHISSLSILFFSLFKNKSVDRYLIIYLILYGLILKLVLIVPFFDIRERFENYYAISNNINWIAHIGYFSFIIGLNVFLFYKDKNVIYNYTYSFIFFTYIFLQFISPILGFRYSIYLILYLLLNPNFKLTEQLEKCFNMLSPLLLIFVFVTYYSIIP